MWEWPRESAKLQFHSARDSMLESAGCLRGKRHSGRCFQSGHVRQVHLSGDFLAARPSDPAVPSCTEIEDEIFVPGVFVPPFADGPATRGWSQLLKRTNPETTGDEKEREGNSTQAIIAPAS
jgi:hypothetical protein